MATLPTSLFWQRTDLAGSEHVVLDDQSGLRARGTAIAAGPLPYTCRYELTTDPDWTTVRLAVTAEGGGWLRSVRLERTGGQWRVPTSEQGNLAAAMRAAGLGRPEPPGIEDRDRLAAAIDVDLFASPLFNSLPVRRLGLLAAEPGTEHQLTMAWIRLPTLEVVPSEQTYRALGGGRVRYSSESRSRGPRSSQAAVLAPAGGFAAELELDGAGYVIRYPGLAARPEGRTP